MRQNGLVWLETSRFNFVPYQLALGWALRGGGEQKVEKKTHLPSLSSLLTSLLSPLAEAKARLPLGEPEPPLAGLAALGGGGVMTPTNWYLGRGHYSKLPKLRQRLSGRRESEKERPLQHPDNEMPIMESLMSGWHYILSLRRFQAPQDTRSLPLV